MKCYKYITFDLYGTLVDINSAIVDYFVRIGSDKAEKLWNEWNSLNFKNLNSRRVSFKESAIEILKPILKRGGLYNDKNVNLFLKSYSEAKPFAETVDFLRKLKQKYKIAIISNVDNDMIERTLTFGIGFDKVITSENAGFYYKPNKKIFEYALQQLKCSNKEILHIAFSVRADVKGVVPLGWDMVWINRDNETVENPKPMLEVRNFKEVLEFLNNASSKQT